MVANEQGAEVRSARLPKIAEGGAACVILGTSNKKSKDGPAPTNAQRLQAAALSAASPALKDEAFLGLHRTCR
jgi:hypothetical protein